MTNRTIGRTAAALLLASTVAVAPFAAWAQAPQPGAAPAATATTPQGKRINAMVESRITELHTRLKITPAEEPQWTAFTQVMRDNAAHIDQVYAGRGDPQKMTAVEDLHAYANITRAHDEDMQKLIPAFETLYNSFTPEQKKAADEAFHNFQRQETKRARHS